MARETRGRMPDETGNLQRASLTAPHWHQVRWWLAGQAALAAGLGLISLATLATAGTHHYPEIVGVQISWALAGCLVAIAAASGVGMASRRVALMVAAMLCVAAVVMIVVTAVAATHDAHPLGSTLGVLLLWAVVFCYNLAVAVWLVPDHIEGPDWVPRRSLGRRSSPASPPERSR